jgi:serine/threonine protein phosphatase PrpC
MDTRWMYQHEGTKGGPVTIQALKELVVRGQLSPGDPVWNEGASHTTAVRADQILLFPRASLPGWLGEVQQAEKAIATPQTVLPLATPRSNPPEWLDDVRQAEAARTPPAAPPAPASPELPIVNVELVALPEADAKRPGQAEAPPTPRAAPLVAPSGLTWGAATSKGMVRDRNEDSYLVLQTTWSNLDQKHEAAAVIVADGMGGHQAGDRASGLVIGAMAKVLAGFLVETVGRSIPNSPDPGKALEQAFHEAHRLVAEVAKADPACQGMGSTAAALLVLDDEVSVGLVGDCRVYHLHDGQLAQVTRDQTIVARMVELGQLNPEEEATHPRRNEILQAVGHRSAIHPAIGQLKLTAGDRLIVACDGLYAHVDNGMLQGVASRSPLPPAPLAQVLVDLANRNGGSDNCTVVIVARD